MHFLTDCHVTHVVRRLGKRELLARNRVPGSGRRTTATLAEAGYEVVVAAAPGHVAAVDAAIKREQPDTGSVASSSPEAPTIHGGPRRTAD
ncbi:hypothetical protein GCM10010504_38450 [Streptomyces griseus]|nr:hypothetical protein GCM10010504_38450 [Streptomyces griseus]